MSDAVAHEWEGTPVFAIDRAFVPVAVPSVAEREVGGDVVLIDEASGEVHALDRIGSVVWSCFDGTADIGTVVDELVEAFDAPQEEVEESVVVLVQTLARARLLQNIALPNADGDTYSGTLEVGEELPSFRLRDLDGRTFDLAATRGSRVVLVNWSPFCGFCVEIARQLGRLGQQLDQAGVGLVLVASGEAEANRSLLAQNRVDLRTALRETAAKSFVDPFPGMGTPVAYLVDEDGRVAEPLALGSAAVPALIERAVGVGEMDAATDGGAGVQYLPAAAEGVCAPGAAKPKTPRSWRAPIAYDAGEYRVGIRTETKQAEAAVGRMLAAHRVGPDPNVPSNYAVVMTTGPTRAARDLNLLLFDNNVVVRTRSPRRLMLALVSYLSSHVSDFDDVLRTSSLAVVKDGAAVLLPPLLEWDDLQRLQPQLARLGFGIVDAPYHGVDLETCELIVREPRLDVDLSALDGLPEPARARTELPPVEPGRYPLRAWFTWTLNEDGAPTRAETLTSALISVQEEEGHRAETLDRLDGLYDRLPFFAAPSTRAKDLVDELEWRLAHGA